MATFKDNQEREWTLSITVDAIKRVQGALEVNLAEINRPGNDGDPPLLTRLETDIILLCDVIYVLVKPDAEQRGVSDEQFGQALGGEAIVAAHDAFWRALADFFRSLRRGDLVKAIEKQVTLVQAAVDRAGQKIDEVKIGDVVNEAFGD